MDCGYVGPMKVAWRIEQLLICGCSHSVIELTSNSFRESAEKNFLQK